MTIPAGWDKEYEKTGKTIVGLELLGQLVDLALAKQQARPSVERHEIVTKRARISAGQVGQARQAQGVCACWAGARR